MQALDSKNPQWGGSPPPDTEAAWPQLSSSHQNGFGRGRAHRTEGAPHLLCARGRKRSSRSEDSWSGEGAACRGSWGLEDRLRGPVGCSQSHSPDPAH